MAIEAKEPKVIKKEDTTMKPLLRLFVLALIVVDSTARPAHAYLDPGVGSHLLQASLAGILGAFFVAKSALRSLMLRLRARK